MDSIKLLESLNPIPDHRGNPGTMAENVFEPPQRRRALVAALAVAATFIVLGALFVRPNGHATRVDTSAEFAAQPSTVPAATTPMPTIQSPIPSPALIAPFGTTAENASMSDPTRIVARLLIPSIDVDALVVEGIDVKSLRHGPGHYPDTPLPGQQGNAAVAGHRTTYGAPFHRLDELVVDDEIFVMAIQGSFEYRVSSVEIVDPDQTEVLDDFDDNRLTLTATHPKYSARERIVVVAELQGEPAPRVSFDSLPIIAERGGSPSEEASLNAPSLDRGAFDDTTQPYFAFTGSADPVATAENFLASQFPEWTTVEVRAVDQTERVASIRWTDRNGTSGWIVLLFADGRFWVWDMTMDGLDVQISPVSKGASGWLKSTRPVSVEVLQAIELPELDGALLDTVVISEDLVGSPQPVNVDSPGGRFQEVRFIARNDTGDQIGGAIASLQSVFRTAELYLVTNTEQAGPLAELVAANPDIVADSVTYDPWQSADMLPYIAPNRVHPPVSEVPELGITALLLHTAPDEATRKRQTLFLQQAAEIGELLDVRTDAPPTRASDVEHGSPVERYVVVSLPNAAQCAPVGMTGSPSRTSRPEVAAFHDDPTGAAASVPWQTGSAIVEFVDASGTTIGFGSVQPEGPRTFFSVLAVDFLPEGWVATSWETIGC